MSKRIIFIFLLLYSLGMSAQSLTYKGNGKILDSRGNKIQPNDVRELLAKDANLLMLYNEGRSKKTSGNIFLVGGLAMMAADLFIALGSDHEYPGALTIAGGLAVVISIPIKIGYSKKIKNVVDEYNSKKLGSVNPYSLGIIANNNGVGVRLSF